MYKIYLRDDVPREQMRAALQGYSVLALDIGYFATRLRPGNSITVTDDVYERLVPQLNRAAAAIVVTHIPDAVTTPAAQPSVDTEPPHAPPAVAESVVVTPTTWTDTPSAQADAAVGEPAAEPLVVAFDSLVSVDEPASSDTDEVETDIEDGEPSDEQPTPKKRGGRRARRSGS